MTAAHTFQVLLLTLGIVAIPAFAFAEESSQNVTKSAEDAPSRIPTFVPRELDALFTRGSYPNPSGACYSELNYRLFKPLMDTDTNEQFPLILFFHGHGSHEMNWHNVGQLKHLDGTVFTDPNSPEKYPFYFVAFQCPKYSSGWLGWFSTCEGDEHESPTVAPAELAMQLVDDLLRTNPIDPDRIYLFGISSGGHACWELALRYPERFAAVVPTATGGAGDTSKLQRIKDVPVWTFHCEGDSPGGVRRSVEYLKSIGGKTHLTETPARPEIGLHNSWFSAFQEYGALEWMLAQSRGSKSSRPAGTLSLAVRWQRYWLELWPRIIPIGILAAICWIGYRSVQRKKAAPRLIDGV